MNKNKLITDLEDAKKFNRGVWIDLVIFNHDDVKFEVKKGKTMLLYLMKTSAGNIQAASYQPEEIMYCRTFSRSEYYQNFQVIDSTQNFHTYKETYES